ncbi:MAG: tetratricopeptide repeat protein [Cyclobacteriaceae bacterium]|nr:tetratricopeptide repeat protein [Cyclobacteriaceae bacterium]
MKRSAKRPVLFGIKAHIKAFLQLYSSTKYLHFRFVNPFFIGALVFLFFYMRLCNNDSGNEGIKYFDIGEYSTALDHYNEYLMLYPHHIETLYNRGRCFEVLGYPDKAAKDYEQVLDKDPNHIMALLSLSQYYYKESKYESAVNLCKYATIIDEQNYLAHYYKARAHHKIGDILEALAEYNSVIDINPDFGFAYFHRSSLMLSIGLQPFGCYDLKIADSLNVKGAREALLKYCR